MVSSTEEAIFIIEFMLMSSQSSSREKEELEEELRILKVREFEEIILQSTKDDN